MEIAADKNQEQLLLNIAYAYTNRYDHRTVPSGAPNTYSAYEQGSMDAVIADYQQKLAELNKPTETTAPDATESVDGVLPPQEKPSAPVWLWYIAAGMLVVSIIVVIALQAARKRRRKRRKMPALILEDPDS